MKELKFDANLGFQLEAISAITDIFDGQKVCQSNFTVRKNEVEENLKLGVQGYANELQLIDEELLENVHAVIDVLKVSLEQSIRENPGLSYELTRTLDADPVLSNEYAMELMEKLAAMSSRYCAICLTVIRLIFCQFL